MGLDKTLFIQLGIYLFIILVLKTLYFEPVAKLLKRRDALTVGRKQESEDMSQKIQGLQAEYEGRLDEVRDLLSRERAEAVQASRDAADKKIQAAKSEAERRLQKASDELSVELKNVRASLPKVSGEVSKEIVQAILNSKVVAA